MRFLTENLALKGVSLALAFGLWFVIAAETTSEIGLLVPLEMQNVPRDLELTGDPVNNVEVRLRASPGIIHALTPADVSAQVDLAGVKEGERIIHLTPGSIRVPFGVNVVRISPAILILRFEQTWQKDVPIRPRITGTQAPGYEVGEITSRPPFVRISGPRSHVEQVDAAFTEPVSIEGARAAITAERNVGLDDASLRIVGGPLVHVTVDIREQERTRVFTAVPITVRGGAALLRPAVVRVTVTGPASLVKSLARESLRPYVDLASAGGADRAAVAIELPPGEAGLRVESVEPREVAVRTTREKERP